MHVHEHLNMQRNILDSVNACVSSSEESLGDLSLSGMIYNLKVLLLFFSVLITDTHTPTQKPTQPLAGSLGKNPYSA